METAKRLLTLSRYNPEFTCKFNNTIFRLDEIVKEKGPGKDTEKDEAKRLISELYAHKSGVVYESIEQVYIQFTTGVMQDRKDSEIFKDVTVTGLVQAREVAKEFLKIANKTISNKVHKAGNKYIYSYINKLAKEFVIKLKADEESKWDTFYELETVTLEVLAKHLIYREDIAHLLKVYQAGYVLQNKIYTENDKFINRMNLFDVSDLENKLNEFQTCNNLKFMFIKNLQEYKDYYKSLETKIIKMRKEGELKSEEYTHYIGKFTSLYSSLLKETACRYYVPLCALQYIKENNKGIEPLLRFTQKEMVTSFIYANKFCKFYTDKRIERLVIDFIDLRAKNLEIRLSERQGKVETTDLITSNLEVLLNNNIITPEDYCNYLIKYNRG